MVTPFPAMRAHEGVWEGCYTHLDATGIEIDRHDARVICEFPASGPVFYIQHIRFTWPDGRVRENRFDGVINGPVVRFDTPNFAGKAWESEDVILLHLDRKDEPGAHFVEAIILAPDGQTRARTWHWFKDGTLIRRTLCDERRVG